MSITLKAARINSNKTQTEMANLLNVRTATICSWEQNKTIPNVRQAYKLANACGVKIDDIAW